MILKLLTFGLLIGMAGCSGNAGSFKVVGSSSSTNSSNAIVIRSAPSTTPSGTPTSFKITVYKAYISENADCSSPILLQDLGSEGEEFDMYASPTLFQNSPEDGEYNCLILQVGDNMKFKVDATAVAAHEGCEDTTTEYTFDVYRAGESDSGLQIDIDGEQVAATGSAASPGADKIWVFASTGDTSLIRANGVAPHENQVGTLSGAMIVPGQVTYFWDATDGVADHEENSINYCWLEELEVGFR